MLQSMGRRWRWRRCYRRRRRGRRCCTHGCQARGDSGNCWSCRQVRRFSNLRPDLSRPNRRAGSRGSMSERCSCEQRGQLSGRHCGACSHLQHALLHCFSLTHSGGRRCGQEQLIIRVMSLHIDRGVRTRRSGRECSNRGMSSCGCMRNSR